MGYFKAKLPFTRRVGTSMLVGHPEHRDPKGRYFKLDDVQAQPLVQAGLIAKTSRKEAETALGDQEVDGGEVIVDQTAGRRPKVSARMTDAALAAEAAARKVDISKAANRHEVIKLINAKDVDGGPADSEGTDNAWSATSRDTAESTRHSRRASPQNDVNDRGTVDTALTGIGTTAAETEIADEEAAPTSGTDPAGQ